MGMEIAKFRMCTVTTSLEKLACGIQTVEKGPGSLQIVSEVAGSQDAFHWISLYGKGKIGIKPIHIFNME